MRLTHLTHFDDRLGSIATVAVLVRLSCLPSNKFLRILMEGLTEDQTGHVFLPNQRKAIPCVGLTSVCV
jgi:hypothetical protein